MFNSFVLEIFSKKEWNNFLCKFVFVHIFRIGSYLSTLMHNVENLNLVHPYILYSYLTLIQLQYDRSKSFVYYWHNMNTKSISIHFVCICAFMSVRVCLDDFCGKQRIWKVITRLNTKKRTKEALNYEYVID